MKKTVFILFAASFFYACGGNDNHNKDEKNSKTDVTDNPDFIKGRDLVNQSGCFTCHKVDEASTGPTYRDVAAKYANTQENVSMLVGKILKGGSGNWGTVPMIAHPHISPDDAASMVKYILLLKK